MLPEKKMLMRRMGLIIALILVLFILGGCTIKKELSPDAEDSAGSTQERAKSQDRTAFLVKDQGTVLVYFATPDGKNLVPVTLSINPTKEAAKVAVEKLLAGPENDFSSGTIPEETKLLDIYLQGRTGYVDLTEEITKIPKEKAEQAVNALVLTLTEFAQVDDVQILVAGQIVPKLGPVDISKPIKRPNLINAYGEPGEDGVKVFFSDANAMYVVPVTVKGDKKNLPLSALKRLIAGPPEESGLFPTIWPGTSVKNLQVEDGVATVDFNAKVLGYGGGTTAESMLVNSVVLTLTQFENIEAVQFLVEGKKMEYFPEGTDVSSPIPAPQKINFVP
ncbi:GerMN domain-containing protein [Candidatus Formimonas warabiya]|uniref:GerMN domain-containing protein n=1 Tax=Formimonas warabiya TaxID=1761012 RepID=A0A3G1KVF6_FORW1|nr:GerMN domain-containing protein [Candidatus Formimonas warabiya]ATW26387.1 hypothetical protein DCMF_17945 [Candidatus Formimonas warabiya]